MSRMLNVKRKSKFLGGGGVYTLLLDNNVICSLGNGDQISYPIDNGKHTIQISGNFGGQPYWSFPYPIEEGARDVSFIVEHKTAMQTVRMIITPC